jgi:hypothetical protein
LSHFYGIELKHGIAAGYPKVTLYKPGKRPKTHLVHRLLAQHFIDNPMNLPFVNHINGDTKDFRLENLEWVTEQENVQDGYTRGRVVWNKGKSLVDRTKMCEGCGNNFQYKKRVQRFCNNSCASKSAIELFKQGIITREHVTSSSRRQERK